MTSKQCTKCKELLVIEEFTLRIDDNSIFYSGRCKDCTKLAKRLCLYNLLESQYFQMLQEQDNKCKICFSEEPLVIDHDHQTNEIRGLICSHCNKLLGFAKDNITILQNAIKYLTKV